MTEQLCPECGCRVGANACEKGGVVYCCESCATGGECQCGCREEDENEERPRG